MATEQELRGWFLHLNTAIEAKAKAEGAQPGDSDLALIMFGFKILECTLVDLNRCANALELIASNMNQSEIFRQ